MTADALREQSRRTKRFELRFTAWHNDVWKPVIAAVNGVCAGGGLHFVADADIVIASATRDVPRPARVDRAGQRLRDDRAGRRSRRRRPSSAWRSPAGTNASTARRAYELGIVSEVVDPPDELRDEAQALAEKIAQNSPAAMAATKRALWGALEMGSPTRAGPRRREAVAIRQERDRA